MMSADRKDVYAHANPIFLRAVTQRGGVPVVLDVGCWNGSFGRLLLRNCDAIVDGIECDADQAAIAQAAGYREVEIIDLNGPIPKAAGVRYDFILFGDVLEHLVHPEVALSALIRRLAPGGRILLSMPNIAFVGNRVSHLLGQWNYRNYGILDRTHLRFFTRRTMIDLVENAGLAVQRVEGYVGLHDYPWFLREPFRFLGRVWPSMFAVQIVIDAIPRPVLNDLEALQ